MPALPFENTLPDTKSAKCRGYKFSPSADVAGGTLAYQHKGHASRYWVERIPADLAGQAFVFRKVVKAGEEQSVNETLLADQPQHDLCSCHGFAAHGHCKHLDILRDLAAHGQLPAPLVETDADAALCDPDADFGDTECDDWAAGEFAARYEDAWGNVVETETASEHIARVRREWAARGVSLV